MDVFVARQPIFDTHHQVVGYELLHRSDGEAETSGTLSPSSMSTNVMVDGLLGMGLQTITGGKDAYINFSREPLLSGAADLLDPKTAVIELHETVEPENSVVAVCEDLVSRGFRLAMDDFVLHPRFAPLLELAEIVKIDVLETDLETMDDMVEELRPYNVTLLAEKVENHTVHKDCLVFGFELFQGFHYFRPETLTSRDLSAQSVTVVRLLNLLRDLNTTDGSIQEAFRSDPSLSFKLLRMVNSAALGGRGIDSIGHALRILGRAPLYRWLSMLLLAEGKNGTDLTEEIIQSSLLRGRMCELLGDRTPSGNGTPGPAPGTLFLIGLFSHLDTLLRIPMEDILSRIDVAPPVRGALLSRKGQAGTMLSAVEAYEEGDWMQAEERVASAGVDPGALSQLYQESLSWTAERMSPQGS